MPKITWDGSVYNTEKNGYVHGETNRVFSTILCPFFSKTLFATNENPNEIVPFTIYFHCSLPAEFRKYSKVVNIPSDPEENGRVHSTFYFFPQDPMCEESSPNTLFKYHGKPIGVLSSQEQIFYCSAWTNAREQADHITHIIKFLSEQGWLQPAPIIEEEPTEVEKINFSISIGGDPEFELVDYNGEIVVAADASSFSIYEEYGNIGVDGSGDQVELRPSPGSPEQVVENVKNLLSHFGKEFGNDYKLISSSEEFPCGGHIHIGVSPLPNYEYFSKMCRVLDDFIGHPTKGLNGPARDEDNDNGYGSIGDWREQDHGMEYRTPPSSVWRNPELTKVVLKLAHNLSFRFANNLSLEYQTPIRKYPQELIEVGGLSPEEAALYLDECDKEPPAVSESLLAAWGIPKYEPIPRIKLEFSDDWDPSIRQVLRKELAKIIVKKPITITFYGLKSKRGDVFTFDFPGKGRISHPNKTLDNTNFGFSRRFREGRGVYSSDLMNVATIIGNIVNDIQAENIPLHPPVEEVEEVALPVREEHLPEQDSIMEKMAVYDFLSVPRVRDINSEEYGLPLGQRPSYRWENSYLRSMATSRFFMPMPDFPTPTVPEEE